MARIFFTYVLPLIAPFLIYLAWNAYARARARKVGDDLPALEKGPVFWSLILGFVLMAGTLVTLAVTGGDPADAGKYIPPRLEDGRIVPPTYEKQPVQ